jgi:hypothetical protein
VIEEQDKPRPRQILELGLVSIKLLCILCTARTNRFYIPGETNLAERIRKRAFDSGTFTVVTHLFRSLKGNEKPPFATIRQEIRSKVLNLLELPDLLYHVRVLDIMLKMTAQSEASLVRVEESPQVTPTKDLDEEARKGPVLTDMEKVIMGSNDKVTV